MAKMIEEISRIKLQFKSLSKPSDIIEFQTTKEFFTRGEADELLLKIKGICSPIDEAKHYEVHAWSELRKTTSEIPPEIKE